MRFCYCCEVFLPQEAQEGVAQSYRQAVARETCRRDRDSAAKLRAEGRCEIMSEEREERLLPVLLLLLGRKAVKSRERKESRTGRPLVKKEKKKCRGFTKNRVLAVMRCWLLQ